MEGVGEPMVFLHVLGVLVHWACRWGAGVVCGGGADGSQAQPGAMAGGRHMQVTVIPQGQPLQGHPTSHKEMEPNFGCP